MSVVYLGLRLKVSMFQCFTRCALFQSLVAGRIGLISQMGLIGYSSIVASGSSSGGVVKCTARLSEIGYVGEVFLAVGGG